MVRAITLNTQPLLLGWFILLWFRYYLQEAYVSNNVVEYSVVIKLLRDAILHGIISLEVRLDLELVVSQLNALYHVRDPTLLRIFLCVILLERQFENITYIHVPRIYNQVADSYPNYVLDWNLFHRP